MGNPGDIKVRQYSPHTSLRAPPPTALELYNTGLEGNYSQLDFQNHDTDNSSTVWFIAFAKKSTTKAKDIRPSSLEPSV